MTGFNKVHTLPTKQLAEAFKKGGIILSQFGANQLRRKVQDLEIVIANPGSFPSATSIQSHFNSSDGVQISAAEAQVIFNHVNG